MLSHTVLVTWSWAGVVPTCGLGGDVWSTKTENHPSGTHMHTLTHARTCIFKYTYRHAHTHMHICKERAYWKGKIRNHQDALRLLEDQRNSCLPGPGESPVALFRVGLLYS